MKVWGITREQLDEIIVTVSPDYFDNIRLENVRENGVRVRTIDFTVRTHDSRGHGSRRTERRRTTSACWHVHRDVMICIFALNPEARIRTALADYRGLDSFNDLYPDTAYQNGWQGGFANRDRDRECECLGPYAPATLSYGQPRERPMHEIRGRDTLHDDAHRFEATAQEADEAIADWQDFIAGLKTTPRVVGR